MEQVKTILGTMTFGPQADLEASCAMVKRYIASGQSELDAAYVYNGGETEEILGTILSENRDLNVQVATKVHPRITGKLDKAAITMQFEESLRRMRCESVEILYLHLPDAGTPIEETLTACAELHQAGKFKQLGLSNYPAWKVVEIWHLCKERGWPLPTVYQGMYNGLTRNVESELLPALRHLNIRFYAFNPLAGGMLTGKHTAFEEAPIPGRFERLQSYRKRYWKESYFEAVTALTATCLESDIKPAEAAYRWLGWHSTLSATEGDGILIGASSMGQLEGNLSAISKGPLPETVVDAFNNAWDEAKADCPPYFQCYCG